MGVGERRRGRGLEAATLNTSSSFLPSLSEAVPHVRTGHVVERTYRTSPA